MSDHLFGSITLPPELDQLVDFHRLHVDQGAGFASLLDGWRAFLRHELATGPMAFLSTGAEHLEHFGAQAPAVVDELMSSPWNEVAALGVIVESLRSVPSDERQGVQPAMPGWLVNIDKRSAVRASVRHESRQDGPIPWVVEFRFGADVMSCVNVWINPDGSLHQLYPSDETIDELEAFLGDLNHLVPNRPFRRVQPAQAFDAIREPTQHPATSARAAAILHWLLRTPVDPAHA